MNRRFLHLVRCPLLLVLFVLLLLPLLAAGMLAGSGSAVAAEPLRQVRIQAGDPQALAAILRQAGFDVLSADPAAGSVDVVVSASDLERLETAGLAPVTVAIGRPFRELQEQRARQPGLLPVPPGYPDLAAVIAEMTARAAAFPAICQQVDLTTAYGLPPTAEGRHLHAVKISDHVLVDEDEPAFLMVSNHHCREIVTPVIALYAIDQLTSLYGSDPAVTELVDGCEIWIAPVWNPDGYEYVFDVDNMWRKNRHVFATGIGVDLNRNYPQGWFNACSGSSSPSSIIYKGPSPASEAETQTMIAWSLDRRFAKVIDYHSSGREVLHGYACWSYPFDAYLEQEATLISNAAGYGGDHRSPSADGEHFEWQFGSRAAYAFLMETATEFQPSYASAQAEAEAVWPSTLMMLERPLPLWGHVTDALTGEGLTAGVSYAGVSFPNGEANTSGGAAGRYHAFLPAGVYDVVFEADGYVARTIPGIAVDLESSTQLDVALDRVPTAIALGDGSGGSAAAAASDLLLLADPLGRALRYQIARPSARATLRVFNVRGALVRTLVDAPHAPGWYEVVWSGRDNQGRRAASGSYYAQLQTERASRSRKILVVR